MRQRTAKREGIGRVQCANKRLRSEAELIEECRISHARVDPLSSGGELPIVHIESVSGSNGQQGATSPFHSAKRHRRRSTTHDANCSRVLRAAAADFCTVREERPGQMRLSVMTKSA